MNAAVHAHAAERIVDLLFGVDFIGGNELLL
jgi:hypothetical protein